MDDHASRSATRTWPDISVVMPVLDEEQHLTEAVGGVLEQDYPGTLELVLALGPSKDRTDDLARDLAARDQRIRLVDNPAGHTPAALNAAIGASRHDVIVRVDAHGALSDGYIHQAVEALLETGAANVGGIMEAVGRTPFEQAVARAYMSPVGLGGGRFHVGGEPGPADTVYLGVFRRDILDRLGGYDEHFRRAQDWELNHRIRGAGELVWFVPALTVTYRPRSTLGALARQFYRTGQWRREVVRLYPETASLRYLAAPVTTVAVTVGAAAGLVALFGGPSWLALGWLAPAGYLLGVLAGSAAISRGMSWRARAWLPVALVTMHLCWGAGFLRGVGASVRRERAPKPVTR